LQELPLILVPTWPLPSLIEADIETWLKQAHLEDQRLRIERRVIPHTPILIPDTAKGQQLFNLAKAIADIPLEAAVFPTNQNQGYWFKTLHYYWQAQGVVIAQRLLGVISDPLAQDGVLTERLADQNLAFLRLSRDIDRACFRLLVRGSRWIKAWASKKNIPYPFKSPQELFLELLKERFLLMWQLGPLSSEKKPLSKAQQREHFAVRLRLLKQSPWLEQQEGNAKAIAKKSSNISTISHKQDGVDVGC
jgi:hypothetical protein